MPDPHAIFRGGTDLQRKMLKSGWPDLYEALGGDTPPPATATRIRPCELRGEHPGQGAGRPPAVGRIAPNGPAACANCLARLRPGNPGGYPLQITSPGGDPR